MRLEPGSFEEAKAHWKKLQSDPVYSEAAERMGRGEHWNVPILHDWRYPPPSSDPAKPTALRAIRFTSERGIIRRGGEQFRAVRIIADGKHVVAIFNEHGVTVPLPSPAEVSSPRTPTTDS